MPRLHGRAGQTCCRQKILPLFQKDSFSYRFKSNAAIVLAVTSHTTEVTKGQQKVVTKAEKQKRDGQQ